MAAESAPLTVATALVLRDRTNSDPHQVLTAAIDDLVATGVWVAHKRRRPWAPRAVFALTLAAPAPPTGLAEPLRTVDALLRVALQELDLPLTAPALGRWLAVHRPAAPAAVVRTTIEDLIARGLLRRTGTALKPTSAGEVALAAAPPPPAVRPLARDPYRRADGVRALSRLGRQLVAGWEDAPLGANGFPPGTVGAGVDPSGQGNGDNARAAIWTGSGRL
jgi:hypothetical protein